MGCLRAGRCGERIERCQWKKKRDEPVATVKISSVRRKAARKFWAPQQGYRPLRNDERETALTVRQTQRASLMRRGSAGPRVRPPF
nr:MAG TPA: hypothetical protein [Caudoviricetes sp.]